MNIVILTSKLLKKAIRDLKKIFTIYYLQIKWRSINNHNYTQVSNRLCDNLFPINKVKVGKYSYGELIVKTYNPNDPNLYIGNFCSIAKGVIFMLGGEHKYTSFMTYPIHTYILKDKYEAISKGPIIVEDDVWIGANSIILSGVTIAKGSIIAAGSIVTHSTKPYSIVGGVPAKLIKYRFSEDIIKKLLTINIKNIEAADILKNVHSFTQDINEKNIQELININR